MATEAPAEAVEFRALARSGFVADAILTIKDMILDGRLEPGDRLPSERALSEALGVSRPTVREAIGSLQAMNILESRHGSGTFVTSLSVEELLRPLQFALALSDFALEHLFEVRLMLEPGAAALAAQRASEVELELLRDCARRGNAPGIDPAELVRVDVELHRTIAQAAANPLLQRLLASIAALAEESRGYTVRLPGVAKSTAGEHDRIAEAICARDPDRARAAMVAHITRIRDAAIVDRGRPPSEPATV
ncbi:MAG TPA: FadR/GntR family transcriptional regulator [Solirubrobacterales bacterium]|nr:FadR/GntR family transcriptional regulator [Solirubrobacterales bacterium]